MDGPPMDGGLGRESRVQAVVSTSLLSGRQPVVALNQSAINQHGSLGCYAACSMAPVLVCLSAEVSRSNPCIACQHQNEPRVAWPDFAATTLNVRLHQFAKHHGPDGGTGAVRDACPSRPPQHCAVGFSGVVPSRPQPAPSCEPLIQLPFIFRSLANRYLG